MTASPGDGEHAAREGYYPDPSIPGYVRYWNGLSWVPGTSRPAPPVDETGPVFLDETSATEALPEPSPVRSPVPLPVPSPEPDPAAEPVMWQADPAHQHGFGGPRDARVSWGSREEPPAPVRGAGVSLGRTAAASPAGSPAASPTPGSAPAPDPAPGPAPDRSPESAAAPDSAPGHAWSSEAAAAPVPVPAPARPSEAAAAAAPAPEWPDAGDGGRAGSGLTSSWPEATPKSRPAPAPTRVQPDPQAYAQAQAQAHVRAASPLPGQSSAPAPAAAAPDAPLPGQEPAQAQPRAAARADGPRSGRGAAPAQAGAPIPAQAAAPAQGQARAAAGGGERGDAAGRRQTAAPSEGARRAESGAAAAGQRPDARAVFERMAERAVRPSGLVRRGLARAVDSLVFAAVAAAAARPLVPAATAHIEAKVDAARGTGRTTTVWLLDATIGGYLGIVLAAVLLFGVFYEALPTARWGRTPGKKLFGVRVLATATLRPPGFGAALRRWLAYALFGLPGGLWCLGDRPRRRGLHDRAAGTYVAR
ncbi:RDD family protein [Streptomyces sp. MJM1172]|uniref:RDD family protein n=1 Tax=Streptomyces sp. MJM1172 TaxID=1703926 RepID=UPI001300CB7F|nr:RDD family protein [Streptomyces sp. MJM1172]